MKNLIKKNAFNIILIGGSISFYVVAKHYDIEAKNIFTGLIAIATTAFLTDRTIKKGEQDENNKK